MNFDTVIDAEVFENSPLATVYYNVLNELKEGKSGRGNMGQRRVALWVAWESHRIAPVVDEDDPDAQKVDLLTIVGLPKTQTEFAAWLGVSTRTIRNYANNGRYAELISTARETGVQRVLGRYDILALHALGSSAATPQPNHSSDRRIFFTMRGLLTHKQDVNLATGSNGMTVEEWKAAAEKRRQQAAQTIELFDDDTGDDVDAQN